MTPGTPVRHREKFADFGLGTVLNPNGETVAAFKRRVPHDLSLQWVYVETQEGKIEGFPPEMLIPQTLEYQLTVALEEVTRIRNAIAERDAPKAGEVWENIMEDFTAVVKLVEGNHIYFLTTVPQASTIEKFTENYRRA